MSTNIRLLNRITLIAAIFAMLLFGTLVAHADTNPGGGFDSLVNNLRKNPVNVEELTRPAPAPAPAQNPLAVSARSTIPHTRTRVASRTHHSTSAEPTVTPYTDSFFHSKVSPY